MIFKYASPLQVALHCGCHACCPWRSRAFDGLGYLQWHAKVERWHAAGRKQRRCECYKRWQWVKKGAEGGAEAYKVNRALQLSFPGWLDRLVETSIETLRFYEDKKPYFGAFSGGKDSVVIKELAAMAGVKVEWCYSVTTVDPPELVQFIWRYHRDVMWQRPVKPLWRRLPEKGIPTRRTRWCCSEYKEMPLPETAG